MNIYLLSCPKLIRENTHAHTHTQTNTHTYTHTDRQTHTHRHTHTRFPDRQTSKSQTEGQDRGIKREKTS